MILTNVMDKLQDPAENVPGVIATNKLISSLNKNPDLAKLHHIAQYLGVKSCESNFQYFTY